MTVKVPEGVYVYFTDSKVGLAVDLLPAKARPKIPEDLEWSEMPAFYRAIAAAKQTQSDFAVLLHDLWFASWKNMPDPWQAHGPSAAGQSVEVATVWENRYFSRTFKLDDVRCELLVYLDEADEGVQIGFELAREKRSLVRKDDLQLAWEANSPCFWSTEQSVPLSKEIDPGALEVFIMEARKVITKKMSLAE